MSKPRRRCSRPTARRLGDDRQAGDRRAAAQWPQRLESRGHDPGRARGHQQRHRVELPRRRSAGDSEQPVARRHQLLGQPAGLDQHAADCRCGRRDSGPDRQHLGRVRLVSGRRDQRGDQERHQRACTGPPSTSSRTMRSIRADGIENPANPKNPLRSNQFGFEIDGPVVIPGLYDGHNKTFFMGAYEGVRAEALSPTFGSVPTALMRQGNFSEISTADQEPVHRPAVCRQHHPAVDAVAGRAEPAAVLPGAERHRHGQQPGDDGVEQGQHRSVPRPRRSEPRQQDPAVCALQLARQPQHLDRRDSGDRRDAAAREQEHAVHLHAHAEADPVQRFPDRLPPPRLRHAEPVLGQRPAGRRHGARHPRVRRRHAATTIPASRASTSATSAASAPAARTGTSSTRRSRSRTCWPRTAARTTCGRDSTCAGWRPAGARPTIRAGCSSSPATSPAIRWPTSCWGCRGR